MTGNQDPQRAWLVGVFVGLLTLLVLQVSCLGQLRYMLWGLHVPVFLPRALTVAGWVLVAAMLAMVLFGPERRVRFPAVPVWAVAIAAGIAFWLLRSRQDLLGDAFPLINSLPGGVDMHPRQPLTMWVQQQLFQMLGPIFDRGGLTPPEIAHRTVAVGSVLSGVGFVFVARGLARELLELVPAERRFSPALLAGLIAFQGWTALFYGYVENYSFVALALAIMLWTLLRALRTGAAASWSALALAVAIGLHLSSAALILVFVLGLVLHWVRHRRIVPVAVTAATLIVLLIALQLGLRRLDPGFSLWPAIQETLAYARQNQGGGAGLEYLLSTYHWNDWFNEQVLLGPAGLLLLGPILFVAVATRRKVHVAPGAVVVLAFGLFTAAGHFATVEPALGYARDWDLFAPTAIFVVTAAVLALILVAPPAALRRVALALLVWSVWHTGSFALVNAVEPWSVERFATLPLGLGRTEVVLGRYHQQEGDRDEARRWFERALRRNPANNTAWSLLSRMDEEDGNLDGAVSALERALQSRPRKPEYHRRLVGLLADAGRNAEAADALERWLGYDPDRPELWVHLARLRSLAGDSDGSREALRRAAATYERTWEQGRSPQVAMQAGDCEAGLGETERARLWYDRALALDPAHGPAHVRFAILALQDGDAVAAEQHRRIALEGVLDDRDRELLRRAFGASP